jgi:hypothetical protein
MQVDGTYCLYEANLVPCGAQDFAYPRGCENNEFQRRATTLPFAQGNEERPGRL